MTLHRFFALGPLSPAGVEAALPLAPGDIHHLRDVLRLESGDAIVLVHEGTAAEVRLVSVAEDVLGVVEQMLPVTRVPLVTLAQGLAKGEKMDDIVRHTTELGVSRILPFSAERSVVKLDERKAEQRVERWRRVAAEAAKQSQRADVPRVEPLAAVADLPARLAGSAIVVCWEDERGAPGIGEALERLGTTDDRDVAVVVGPEGGLTDAEVRALVSAGAVTASLGPTILRTETAGVVATAIALYVRGGLGARRA